MNTYPEFFCEPHKLLKINNSDSVLIALSGGADSCALLYLLCRASQELGFTLYAAHVNHGIRTESYGNEAERDEQFCRDICSSLGVKLFTHHVDVPSLAKENKTSLETAAREVRYSFFAEIMEQNSIKTLATAHNADDSLETQIFNLARGCGIEGMRGIPEIRGFSKVKDGVIVRPILSATKTEIINFCKENNIKFVTDSTNLEDDCTRNRIRHNIIPELCSLFGSPQKAGARLARLAASDSEYLEMTARDVFDRLNGEIKLSELNSLHPSIASRVISIAYSSVARTFGGEQLSTDAHLEQAHIEAVLRLAKTGTIHSSISLPQKIAAKIEQDKLIFTSDEKEPAAFNYDQQLRKGINVIPNTSFAVFIGDPPQEQDLEAYGSSFSYFSSTKIKSAENDTFSARNRREGDQIRDGGMTKKVKKLLCDKKVALEIRNSLPIICQQEKIVYIPTCAVADGFKVGSNDAYTQITIYRKN